MIPSIFIKLATAAVGERYAKPAAALALIVVLLVTGFILKLGYDRRLVETHELRETAKRAPIETKAATEAADQRAKDQIRNADNERKRQDAIDSAPKGNSPSPADILHNCERLRQAGYPTDQFAACQRSNR